MYENERWHQAYQDDSDPEYVREIIVADSQIVDMPIAGIPTIQGEPIKSVRCKRNSDEHWATIDAQEAEVERHNESLIGGCNG